MNVMGNALLMVLLNGSTSHIPTSLTFSCSMEQVGLNIHDPKNMSWWSSSAHKSAAYGYNKSWDNFFEFNPSATRQQIEEFGSSLMKGY